MKAAGQGRVKEFCGAGNGGRKIHPTKRWAAGCYGLRLPLKTAATFAHSLNSGTPSQRTHLVAALAALLVAGGVLAAGLEWCQGVERGYVHELAADFSDSKLQGAALQKAAFAEDDLLILYGSSELTQNVPTSAEQFFRDYPTGFRVFPVGKHGTAALSMLQKVAAVGPGIAGRKVAHSISPGFFFEEIFDPGQYAGTFSAMQAYELAFSRHLSPELKRDVARRMLAFPQTLEDDWLLGAALERLAGDTATDRALYSFLCPLGYLNNAIGRAQDHVEATLHILDEEDAPDAPGSPRQRVRIAPNWSRLVKSSAQMVHGVVEAKRKQARKVRPKSSRDKVFLERVGKAREWTDAELLLRTFQELNAKPLLLCMPIEDVRLEAAGLSPAARDVFIERLKGLAKAYNFPLLTFREHESDAGFLSDFFDHLSAKGWIYYDRALDDFYHDRPLNTAPPAEPPSIP